MTQSDIPRPEYPRPQMVRPDWMNLNGVWQFEMDPGRSGRDRGLPQTERLRGEILVPFCPESRLSGIAHTDFIPAVWYRREFDLPETWEDRRILLHFGAVDYDAWVYVNGREAGRHRGGYASFALDVTDHLERGRNVVTVYAEDDSRSPLQPRGKQSDRYHSYRCLYTRTTGIWQTVWLEAVPEVYIASLRLTPLLEQGALLVQARLAGESRDLWLGAEARAEGEMVGEARCLTSAGWGACMVPLADVRAWSPQDPFLYQLSITLGCEEQTLDRVESYFGLRSFGVCEGAVLLNGRPFFQRLVLDQGFYPDGIYTAPSEEALRRDIVLSQSLGFNGARLHQKVFEPRFLYWADRLGYLVWGEFPNWGLDHSHPAALERVLAEWPAVVERDYSHPSVIGWCPFNETPANQNPELVRTVYRVTKALDPTRPVIDTSGYVHVETDMWDVHDYAHGITPEQFAARYDAFARGEKPWRNSPQHEPEWEGQPYWVSEYGGIWWNPGQVDQEAWGYGDRPRSVEEFVSRYRTLTQSLLRNPRVWGFCYTQLTDVEQEVNGLYYYDRSPKFTDEVMQRIRGINCGKAAVEE
ncbi:MAG: beta-galactosidase [Anaerolineae bacterium]|nr:beta-galactosidase [Anaerolineae bacterium]